MDVAKLVVEVSTKGADVAEKELNRLGKTAGAVETASSKMGLAIAGIAFAQMAREAIKMADSYKLIESRLGLVTKSTNELANAQSELFKIAQNTRQSFKDTADLYVSLARATQQLGKSQSETLGVTDTINKAIIISGASAESAKAALVQLGQGFASGTLRGEELNSVLEQTPRVAEAIAKGMGVTVGQLRALGAEGALTGREVFEALQKQAQAVDSEFSKMPLTVSQATENMSNSIMKYVGELDKATGVTSAFANEIKNLSKSMDENTVELVATGQFITATLSRTIDVFNLLYETVENTGQIVIGHINLLAYGSLEVILTMLTKVTEGLNVLGLASDAGLKVAYEDLNTVKKLVVDANNLIADSYDDLDKAVLKLSPTIEDRIKEYNRLKVSALGAKNAEAEALLDDRFTRSTEKTKKQLEDEFDIYKKAEDEKTKILTKSKEDAQKLAEEWAVKKREITASMAIAEQDELAKPFIILDQKYQEDLIKYASINGAKTRLTEEFNAELIRLGNDTAIKVEEKYQQEKEKTRAKNEKSIQKELKLQEENFRIQERQVALLDDEADREVATSTLQYQRTQASLSAQLKMGEVSETYYDAMMNAEEKLLEKQKQNWTVYGQIINNTTAGMENSFMGFFDATNDGYMKLGELGKSIMRELYQEALRVALIKPLVGALTSAAMSGLSGMFSTTSATTLPNASTSTAFTGSEPLQFAHGGTPTGLGSYSNQVVSKPTYFAFASGGVPNGGLMGEAGSEAIMPLTRTSNGDLGVSMVGGGGSNVTINIENQTGMNIDLKQLTKSQDDKGNEIRTYVMKFASSDPEFRTALGLSR